jgi:hypothetical protein
LNDVVLRKTLPVGPRRVDISGIVDPLLDRQAEAILAHGRMLWGDEARGLQVLWMTGGGAQLLGARLRELAPHATLVTNARIRNAVGFYRFFHPPLPLAGLAGWDARDAAPFDAFLPCLRSRANPTPPLRGAAMLGES